MSVRVEVVGPDDWELWRELRLEALQDTPIGFVEWHADALRKDESDWRARLSRDGHYVVAYDGDEPAGMSLGYLEEGLTTLGAVFVRPAARRRGVLEALVAAVEDWARGRGSAQLDLFVHEDNARARRAYERLGFTATGRTIPYDLVEGQREEHMTRPL